MCSSLPYENVLYLNIYLKPVPGRLYIYSNYKDLTVLINNSKFYFSAYPKKEYMELQPTTQKRQKLYLFPGEYILTVKKSENIIKTKKIVIKPGKIEKIHITYRARKKQLKLK